MFVLSFHSCTPFTERMTGYLLHGIDVSHYQAQVNWEAIASQNISFAFVKASEGEDFTDSLFQSNWAALKRVGIKRGAYHFFRPTRSVYKQARNFISQVKLEAGDLPPVLDVEVTNGASNAITVMRIQTWLEMIESHYRIRPIIYTNLNFYHEYIAGNFDDYPLWIARYNKRSPKLDDDRQWHFWQYGDRGRIEGINGDVDFNVFFGQPEELEALCVPRPRVLSMKVE